MEGERPLFLATRKIAKSHSFQSRIARKSGFFMSYGSDLQFQVEKGTYTLDSLPPRELLLVQLQYHKQHKSKDVIAIGKIARNRIETGYRYTGQFTFIQPTSEASPLGTAKLAG